MGTPEDRGAALAARGRGPPGVEQQLDLEQALLDLRDRLDAADCEITEVVDHGFVRSVYFTDPNGIALEASWWAIDGTGRAADYGDKELFSDPDPVPAAREIAEHGAVLSVPTTTLTDDEIVDPV